jgi:hypothetical protein
MSLLLAVITTGCSSGTDVKIAPTQDSPSAALTLTGTEPEHAAASVEVLPIVGRWRGTDRGADKQGEYVVEAHYSFEADGTLSAEMDDPLPMGKQHYGGKYRTLAGGELEVRLVRWGEAPRKFKVDVSRDLMIWVDEKGNKIVFQRLK